MAVTTKATERLRFTILGCGSSGGVPRLGGEGMYADWGRCDSQEPKNRRRRCSLLIEKITLGQEGVTRVLVDTTPDMRSQLLDVGVGVLDGVVYTHDHADHTNGLDDLRQVYFNVRRRLPVWADAETTKSLIQRFRYAFEQVPGSYYTPILYLNLLEHGSPLLVSGAGGDIKIIPFACGHGEIDALGFRIGQFAYLPDAVHIPEKTWTILSGLRVWVVDALRRKPHPSHAHLGMTLEWIQRADPEHAILTNLHNDMDYATLRAELPPHITPAYDGMVIELEAQAF